MDAGYFVRAEAFATEEKVFLYLFVELLCKVIETVANRRPRPGCGKRSGVDFKLHTVLRKQIAHKPLNSFRVDFYKQRAAVQPLKSVIVLSADKPRACHGFDCINLPACSGRKVFPARKAGVYGV